MSSNSLGRSYAISLVLGLLGLEFSVVSLCGEVIWQPLRGTEFARKCRLLSRAQLNDYLATVDKIIVIKPLPSTLGVAIRLLGPASEKIILDIDDPDLELRLGWYKPAEQLIRSVCRPSLSREQRMMQEFQAPLAKIVSNPGLQRLYGGILIPHVRKVSASPEQVSRKRIVCFLGTPRSHKNLRSIRRAIARINHSGSEVKFIATSSAPSQVFPWEEWIGTVDFNDRETLLREAMVSVITLWREPYRSLQLPAKVVDSLTHGVRVVYNSSSPILEWATGGSGVPIHDKSQAGLSEAIKMALDQGPLSTEEIRKAQERFAPETYSDGLATVLGTS